MFSSLLQWLKYISLYYKKNPKIHLASENTRYETYDDSLRFLLEKNLTAEICKYNFIPFPFTGIAAKNYLRKIIIEQKGGKGYYFLMYNKIDSAIVGAVRILNINHKKNEAEFGTWLKRDFWGTGRNKEVKDCLCDFSFNELNLKKLYCHVLTNNKRSVNQFNKLNFTFEGKENNVDLDVDRYTFFITNSDFNSNK